MLSGLLTVCLLFECTKELEENRWEPLPGTSPDDHTVCMPAPAPLVITCAVTHIVFCWCYLRGFYRFRSKNWFMEHCDCDEENEFLCLSSVLTFLSLLTYCMTAMLWVTCWDPFTPRSRPRNFHFPGPTPLSWWATLHGLLLVLVVVLILLGLAVVFIWGVFHVFHECFRWLCLNILCQNCYSVCRLAMVQQCAQRCVRDCCSWYVEIQYDDLENIEGQVDDEESMEAFSQILPDQHVWPLPEIVIVETVTTVPDDLYQVETKLPCHLCATEPRLIGLVPCGHCYLCAKCLKNVKTRFERLTSSVLFVEGELKNLLPLLNLNQLCFCRRRIEKFITIIEP